MELAAGGVAEVVAVCRGGGREQDRAG